MLAQMSVLSSWLLVALGPRTLGLASEPIRGGRQVTIMAVFYHTLLQDAKLVSRQVNLLLQQAHLILLSIQHPLLRMDFLLRQGDLLVQESIFLFQREHLFVLVHVATVPDGELFVQGPSPSEQGFSKVKQTSKETRG